MNNVLHFLLAMYPFIKSIYWKQLQSGSQKYLKNGGWILLYSRHIHYVQHHLHKELYIELCKTSKMDRFAKHQTIHIRCLTEFWIGPHLAISVHVPASQIKVNSAKYHSHKERAFRKYVPIGSFLVLFFVKLHF